MQNILALQALDDTAEPVPSLCLSNVSTCPSRISIVLSPENN